MMHRHELTDCHVAMRAQKCRKILKDIDEGMLPNLVFTDEKKFDIQQVVNQQNDRVWASLSATEERIVTRCQNPSLSWFGQLSQQLGGPPPFCPIWSLIELPVVCMDILEGFRLPWANQHFQGKPCTLQQDSALSHGSKFTQSWIQRKIPSFISKEDWPARSPDLNPLDYSIWSI